jgi:NAD(P)-dependent dehydrogenase (short-subunit alcohol dehydrogenase family)
VGQVQGAPNNLAQAALIAFKKHIAMENGHNNIRACSLALVNIATEETFYPMSQEDRKMASKEASMKIW